MAHTWAVRPAAPAYQLDASKLMADSPPLSLPLKLFVQRCEDAAPGAVFLAGLPRLGVASSQCAGSTVPPNCNGGVDSSQAGAAVEAAAGAGAAAVGIQLVLSAGSACVALQRVAVPLSLLTEGADVVLDVTVEAPSHALRSLPCIFTCQVCALTPCDAAITSQCAAHGSFQPHDTCRGCGCCGAGVATAP
jgi:hypothetical protein